MTGTVATRRAGAVAVSTITVGATPTGALINPMLLGGLGGFTDQGDAGAGPRAALRSIRTDGFLNYTPTRIGAPDGAHPTLGHSGTRSYDFTKLTAVVLGARADGATELYPTLTYTPQDLGGDLPASLIAPFNTGWYTGPGGQVPTDSGEFAARAVDMLHHIIVTLGMPVAYVSVGNEPDVPGNGYWLGNQAQYFAHYAACATAIRAYNPALKLVGLEIANNDSPTFTAWVTPFLVYCKANNVPLDAIAHHEYLAYGWVPARTRSLLTQSIAAAAWTLPLDLLCTEWSPFDPVAWPGFGTKPWGTSVERPLYNDAGAAVTAITLIEMQAAGYVRAHFFKSRLETTDPPGTDSGLYGAAGPFSTGNDFELFAKLGSGHVLPTTINGDPGLHALACSSTTDLTGTVRVLIANHHYERTKTYPTTITVPVADGRATTLWVIDRNHSNRFDAGSSHTGLETIACPATLGGQVVVPDLAARSVCLLEIAP